MKVRIELRGKDGCYLEKQLPGFIPFVITCSQGCMAHMPKSSPTRGDTAGHHYSLVLVWKKWISKEKSISSNFDLSER